MKKYFPNIFVLACAIIAAQSMTASAINIAQVDSSVIPLLPNAADYACMAYKNMDNPIFLKCFAPAKDNTEDRLKAYNGKLDSAKDKLKDEKDSYQEKNQEIAAQAEAAKQKSAANNRLKQMSGMDINTDDLDKMTESQKQQFGMKVAARQMSQASAISGMFGGMSQAEMMKVAAMSEADQEAYMRQKMSGSNGTGLTPAEMKMIENMSDAEFAAYARKNPDVIGRMQNSKMGKAAAANAKKNNARSKADHAEAGSRMQAAESLKQSQKDLRDAVDAKNMKAARKQIRQLFNEQYKAAIKQAREDYSACYIKYSPNGYIHADGHMSESEVKAMNNAEKNCQKNWDSKYQEFTLKAGNIWAKAVRQDLNAIKTASANGTLKKLKIAAYFQNFDSPEMKNYVNNMPGIDGTDEYIQFLEQAGKTFDMPKEAAYCDQAWLVRAKKITDKTEKNDFYNGHKEELGGCTAAQLQGVGISSVKGKNAGRGTAGTYGKKQMNRSK